MTTKGLDLLTLPVDSELQIGPMAVVRLTGLRNPCKQLDDFHQGLTQAVLDRAADASLVRKASVMGMAAVAGEVALGNSIAARLPSGPHQPLERV